MTNLLKLPKKMLKPKTNWPQVIKQKYLESMLEKKLFETAQKYAEEAASEEK